LGGETQKAVNRTRYLLGGGSEAERERLEAEFFADDDAFQEMLTAEDDLIDAYARGELLDNEGRQFKQRFMNSSAGRERVQFARSFAAASGPRTAPAPATVPTTTSPGFFASIIGNITGLRAAFATLAIVAFVGFAWLLVERVRINSELNELRAEHAKLSQQAEEFQRTAAAERLKNAETLAQLKDVQDQLTVAGKQNLTVSQKRKKRNANIDNGSAYAVDRRSEAATQDNVVFDVNSGATRGGGGNTLAVSRNVKSIMLRLGLEAESSREEYRAMIETADGRQVKSINFRVASASHDRINLPVLSARELRPGDYVIFLLEKQPDNTFERVATYSLRIVNR
jgi:hypothetical protein